MGGVRYYFDPQGVLSSKVGIDVSTYQGKIDWAAVKNAGVDFVFIRAGFRGWGSAGSLRTDACFKQNIEGLRLPVWIAAYTSSARRSIPRKRWKKRNTS